MDMKKRSFKKLITLSLTLAMLTGVAGCGKQQSLNAETNPDTPVSAIKPYLNRVDMVLIMSVNPGFGGQKFITSSVDKIKEVKRLRDELNLSYDIEVDGGINIDNLATVLEAGANVIVAGSAIFRGDAAENVKKFKSIMSVW